MANPDRSIDGKILENAKIEFMEKGFAETSLRDICKKAGVTTGALYKRYSSKEELFHDVVRQTIEDLGKITDQKTNIDFKEFSDEQLCDMCNLGKQEEDMLEWFKFLYERRDDIFLLLARAGNSQYSNFQHDWVDQIMKVNYPVYEEIERRGLTEFHTSREELHILQSAFWQALYEPFIHESSWKEIEIHCSYISRFFNWPNALGFKIK